MKASTQAGGETIPPQSVCINGTTVVSTGRWMRVARIRDEELVEGEPIRDPRAFVSDLKTSGLGADIFTFAQKLPNTSPLYSYPFEWDNVAVIPITSYQLWWKSLSDSVQRAVKKAAKTGVIVKEIEFDDELVRGIQEIYNESPFRQGRPFWHYQKDFELVKAENSTYSERSTFLGAYFDGKLIGFIRLTRVGQTAEIIQILSKMTHQEKRPTNALIAKAVEVCEKKGISHLGYCNYVYNDPDSTLTEFKRRNGFQKVLVPRYYIPLTFEGQIALKLGLHHRLVDRIPTSLMIQLRRLRKFWHARQLTAEAS
jgi:hypothetical protein